jgi:hypothetical protein
VGDDRRLDKRRPPWWTSTGSHVGTSTGFFGLSVRSFGFALSANYMSESKNNCTYFMNNKTTAAFPIVVTSTISDD